MKDIRIFIASSKELEKERNYLAFLVLAKEDEFAARGLRVRLAKWEYVDPKMTEARTEDRYLDEMYNCDAALVLFRDIAGMYTREELDKALAREQSEYARLKAHRILFAADGAPDSDAAKLRASLPEGSYGVWSGEEELRAEFLSLVDKVVQCDNLIDAPSDAYVRKITAFLAADEELAEERNAFADTVLNVNDLLEQAHRNIRVQLKFYDPANAESVVEASEMGLVLYGTNYRMFGRDEVKRIYERVKDEKQNPKRFYVFFRDLDLATEKSLDEAFKTFRNDFVSKLGHFTCKFGDANALRLSFLLSLERYAGESVELYSTVSAPTAPVFVGREEELRKLCGLLEPVPGMFPAGRLPVITGAGGTGKSELVRQFASQLRVQYPGGVFQVDMEHRRTWDEAFLGILDGTSNNGVAVKTFLGLDEDKKSGGERAEELMTGAKVRDALLRKARENGPVLLVLDNVEGFEEMLGEDGAFTKAFPSGFSERVHVNVVATARTCDVPLRENDWAQVFALGDLSLDAALELLFADKKAESEEEKKGAERVAELLGRRALFLRRVPGILKGMRKKSDFACRTYADLAKKLETDVLETIGKTGRVDPSYWPARLWEIVQGNLAEWGLGEACIKLVKIASFFSPDGFPEHILRHLWNELVYPGLEDWGTQEDVFTEVVDLAKKYNLFQSDDPVRIHRLDRAAILQTASDEPGLEDSIGQSLAKCEKMPPEDWLDLAMFTNIVKHVPRASQLIRYRFTAPWYGYAQMQAFILEKNPQFEQVAQWNRLEGEDWAYLLANCPLPQFEKRFDWNLWYIGDLVEILGAQPKYENDFPWDDLDQDLCRAQHWARLLSMRPEFASRCRIWDDFSGEDWSDILSSQPQFANRCLWDKLTPQDWACLIANQPQFSANCPWEELSGFDWAQLLRKQPSFADKCPFEILQGEDWSYLLETQPQFAAYCSWRGWKCSDWVRLLVERPEFSDHCPWDSLSGSDWANLLGKRSRFAVCCSWEKLRPQDWAVMVRDNLCFAERCPWAIFDGKMWSTVLSGQPQLACRCPWVDTSHKGNLDEMLRLLQKRMPRDWSEIDDFMLPLLLVSSPDLIDDPEFCGRFDALLKVGENGWCEDDTVVFSAEGQSLGMVNSWAFVLMHRPELSRKCRAFDLFSGRSRCLLLSRQPQFAEKWSMGELADINSRCWPPQNIWPNHDYTFDSAWDVLVDAQPQFEVYRQRADALDSGHAECEHDASVEKGK